MKRDSTPHRPPAGHDPHCTCPDCMIVYIQNTWIAEDADTPYDPDDQGEPEITEREHDDRERGDDDGAEYGDPRDEREERRNR